MSSPATSLPYASPLLKHWGPGKDENMAEAIPPRRAPFMNPAFHSQPRGTAVGSVAMAKRALFLAVLLALSGSAAGAPVIVTRESKALDFNYQWPAEVASVPSLQRHLQADMTKALRQ